jgi:hypothetical protein
MSTNFANNTLIIRSQVASVLRRVAAEYAHEALVGIMEIGRDKTVDPQARLKAFNSILDRAAGKPTQEIADENFDPTTLMEKMRIARQAADEVMSLAPPSERPMGEVITLRPTKVVEVRSKVPRRKYIE